MSAIWMFVMVWALGAVALLYATRTEGFWRDAWFAVVWPLSMCWFLLRKTVIK
jgi:hypothetical protein